MRKSTAFVREVVLPGFSIENPRLKRRYCRCALTVHRSPIHRWGVFAREPIPARRRVIEYTGQRIDRREVWRRHFREHLYVFWVDDNWAIDAAFGGSGAEFINHSCEPNLIATVVRRRIYFTTLRAVVAGEELTLDYHLDADDVVVKCACGASACRGTINRT